MIQEEMFYRLTLYVCLSLLSIVLVASINQNLIEIHIDHPLPLSFDTLIH